MPAENEFEKAFRQKLEAFELPPADADWEAVYKALHPTNRSRYPFWWWPLAGLLLAGLLFGIWKWQGPAAMAGTVTSANLEGPLNAQELTTTDSSTGANAINNQLKRREAFENPATVNNVRKMQPLPGNLPSPAPERGNQLPVHLGKKEDAKINELHISKEIPDSKSKPNNPETAADMADIVIPHKKTSVDNDTFKMNGQVLAAPMVDGTPDSIALPFDEDLMVEPRLTEYLPAGNASSPAGLHQNAEFNPLNTPGPAPEPGASAATRHLQLPKASRSWNLGLWLAAGSTHPSESFGPGGTKASADYAGGVTTGTGRSYTFASSSYQNGFNLAGGVNIEKTWLTRWKLIGGLGAGISQWGQSGTIYKDSILQNGAFFSREMVENFDQTFTRIALQVPVTIYGKIGRGTRHSVWWNAGLQNQFLLSLKAAESRVTLSQNLSADKKANNQTSSSVFYQPALVQGFMYQHAGTKYRWQIQPVLSLPLGNVYKASANNSVYPLEWQVQFRWMW